jgi:hypothetical protein
LSAILDQFGVFHAQLLRQFNEPINARRRFALQEDSRLGGSELSLVSQPGADGFCL